ncbi:transposase (plasmid) [Acaryochloris marina S15]|nr:transposase [Acaryochloris marina S15]
MEEKKRPLLSELACVNSNCESYGQAGLENLTVRKVYGQDRIRYLRCHSCGAEFSERKNTAFWNTKIPESRAIEVGRQIAEGTSIKGTSRLTYTHPDTVKRLTLKFGQHAQDFHEQEAQQLDIDILEMDERHGYVASKKQQCWDAVSIDAASKFIVHVAVGPRNTDLIERLMQGSHRRLAHPQDLVLMTDGEASYRTLFPVIFGVSYLPPVKARWVDLPTPSIGFLEPLPTSKSSSIVRDKS